MRGQILYLVEKSGAFPNACSFVRILIPLYKITQNHRIIVKELKEISQLGHPNTIALITNRTAFLSFPGLKKVIENNIFSKLTIVWDTDDYSMGEFESEVEKDYLRKLQFSQHFMEKHASFITCSTRFIMNNNSNPLKFTLVRNSVAAENWHANKIKNYNRLAFFGTQVHRREIDNLSNQISVARKKRLFPKGFEIKAYTNFEISSSRILQRVSVPYSFTTYPKFSSWLASQIDCGIGLILISNTSLNQGKSALKFLEYSSMGLATLAYDHVAIDEDETARHNTFTISREDTLESILELIRDKEILKNQAKLNYEEVLETRTTTRDKNGMYRFIENRFLSD